MPTVNGTSSDQARSSHASTIAARTVVLPVPGGPQRSETRSVNDRSMAVRWRSLNGSLRADCAASTSAPRSDGREGGASEFGVVEDGVSGLTAVPAGAAARARGAHRPRRLREGARPPTARIVASISPVV